MYADNCVYKKVAGWDAFEPTLTRAEQMDLDKIWRLAADIPEEWYEGDTDGLHRLVETLYARRSIIRSLISEFQKSNRDPFPHWHGRSSAPVSLANSLLSADSRHRPSMPSRTMRSRLPQSRQAIGPLF